jgi:hypothetical protein
MYDDIEEDIVGWESEQGEWLSMWLTAMMAVPEIQTAALSNLDAQKQGNRL